MTVPRPSKRSREYPSTPENVHNHDGLEWRWMAEEKLHIHDQACQTRITVNEVCSCHRSRPAVLCLGETGPENSGSHARPSTRAHSGPTLKPLSKPRLSLDFAGVSGRIECQGPDSKNGRWPRACSRVGTEESA